MLPFTDQKRWGGKIFDLPVCQLDQVYILCPFSTLAAQPLRISSRASINSRKDDLEISIMEFS